MKFHKAKTYLLLLLVMVLGMSTVLSVGQSQAHYTNTAVLNTVLPAAEEPVTSDCLVSNGTQVILLGELPEEGRTVTFTLATLQEVTAELTCATEQSKYIKAELAVSEGEAELDKKNNLTLKQGTAVTLSLKLTPTEKALETPREAVNADVAVSFGTLKGTFRVTIPAVGIEEEPTEPDGEQPETDAETDPTTPTEPEDPTQPEETMPETSEPTQTPAPETEETEDSVFETEPEETTEATQPQAVPLTGQEDPVEPSGAQTESSEDTPETTEETEEPSEMQTEPLETTEETAEPSEEQTTPSEESSEPAEETTEPSEDPLAPTDETETPTEEPADATEPPTEGTTAPTEDPTEPVQEPSEPDEGTEPSEPDEAFPKPEADTLQSLDTGAVLPLILKPSGTADRILLGLEQEGEMTRFPAFTRYVLDGVHYLLYDGGCPEIPVKTDEQTAVLLDLSAMTLKADTKLTLKVQEYQQHEAAGAYTVNVTVKAADDRKLQPRFLTHTVSDVAATSEDPTSFTVELPDEWIGVTDLELKYSVEMMDVEESGITYKKVALDEGIMAAEYIRDPKTKKHTLTVMIEDKLPRAGTYRLNMQWSYHGILFEESEIPFFVQFPAAVESA